MQVLMILMIWSWYKSSEHTILGIETVVYKIGVNSNPILYTTEPRSLLVTTLFMLILRLVALIFWRIVSSIMHIV